MDLSHKNLEIAAKYFLTGDTSKLDSLGEDYKNLFLVYATDNNSSTLRELVTLYLCGYESYAIKHGPDGYNPVTNQQVEIKPIYRNNRKLGRSGNFNDMNYELLKSKEGLLIVCSFFYNDRLVYIVEFPIELIQSQLLIPIINAKAGRRVVCSFGYNHYDGDKLNVRYYDDSVVDKYNCLSKPHREMLKRRFSGNDIKQLSE